MIIIRNLWIGYNSLFIAIAKIPRPLTFGFIAPEKPSVGVGGQGELCLAIGAGVIVVHGIRRQRSAPFTDDNWLLGGVAVVAVELVH